MDIFSFDFFMMLLTDTGSALDNIVSNFGVFAVYTILFAIIFCETGLVVTPFLPGDSMLFITGIIAHRSSNDVNIVWLIVILCFAAILGDLVNYLIGKFFGEKLFSNPKSKIFKQSYLEKTNKFYEKHGGKTIIIARFVPIVRTFAPFVAGMGKMCYKRFGTYNIIGGMAWIAIFSLLGYFLGSFDIVKNNLKVVVIIIIVISVIPGIIEMIKVKLKKRIKYKLTK